MDGTLREKVVKEGAVAQLRHAQGHLHDLNYLAIDPYRLLLRPPLSESRLSRLSDGRVRLQLQRPWKNDNVARTVQTRLANDPDIAALLQ